MNLNLEGKVVIVTGAGRGIGRAIALTFCKEGAAVVTSDIDLDAATKVRDEAEGLGAQAIAFKTDVTKPDEVKRMVDGTLGKFGKLDILVNNAGILYVDGGSVVPKLFQQTTEADWAAQIDITLYGVMNCTMAAIKPMLSQKSGSIINIVSDAGRAAGPRTSVYGAGKGGIIALSRTLALELGPSGIRVNCISPGLTKTTRIEQAESGGKALSPEALKHYQDGQEMVRQTPLGRVGNPQEIANVVVLMASDVCSYVTGQTLSVNGGRIMP